MIKQNVTISNKLGMHARAAAQFVTHASRYVSDVTIIKDGHSVNGKSIMAVMLLAAKRGTLLEIIANGEDEKDALADLVELINNRFGESE